MLKNLIIFSLSVVAIHAFGEFTILSTHKSLAFKGKEALESEDVGEVLYSALGNPVSGNVQWPGLQIADPFHLPKQAVIVSISGVDHSKISDTGKTYKLHGNTLEQSVNGAISRFEADGEPVCVFSFKQFEDGKQSFKNTFGDVEIPPIAKTKHLNANLHKSDKQCLESLAYFSAIADNLPNLKTPCKILDIGLFFDDIAKLHGEEGLSEALDLASTAMKKLNIALQKSGNNDALVVVAVNKASNNSRSKREASPDDAKTKYNLAEYYNEDYPVIFNIILWFMVVFGFALLAICYAIGSMDPGRDSIIYRMTSTRMKKDN